MLVLSNILVIVMALMHFGFPYLEMFLWTQPYGRKVFKNTPEQAETMKVLAANQGLYNGFLAAGLVWSVVTTNPYFAFELKVFFLICVLAAAAYGGYSVSRRILLVQGIPALLALVLTIAFANPYLDPTCCMERYPPFGMKTTFRDSR